MEDLEALDDIERPRPNIGIVERAEIGDAPVEARDRLPEVRNRPFRDVESNVRGRWVLCLIETGENALTAAAAF